MRHLKHHLALEDNQGPTLYQPLSAERVADLQAGIPSPDKLLDLTLINARIAKVWFKPLDDEDGRSKSIACTIQLDNGFEVHGVSSALFNENYIQELGQHFAYQKAYADLIPIAAFLQREADYNIREDLAVM